MTWIKLSPTSRLVASATSKEPSPAVLPVSTTFTWCYFQSWPPCSTILVEMVLVQTCSVSAIFLYLFRMSSSLLPKKLTSQQCGFLNLITRQLLSCSGWTAVMLLQNPQCVVCTGHQQFVVCSEVSDQPNYTETYVYFLKITAQKRTFIFHLCDKYHVTVFVNGRF